MDWLLHNFLVKSQGETPVTVVTPFSPGCSECITVTVLLARDAQAKLALIVAQCLSINLSICVSICPSATTWVTRMYAALRVASHVDYRLVLTRLTKKLSRQRRRMCLFCMHLLRIKHIIRRTKFFGSSVLEDASVGWVESDASHYVAELGSIYHSVTTVPEVEQVEHVPYVCAAKQRTFQTIAATHYTDHKCWESQILTVLIKLRLFYSDRTVYVCMYDSCVWSNYTDGCLSKLKLCYHKCIKMFLVLREVTV